MHRWFSLFGVKPHLAKTFKLSTDPFFIEKVRDITGLYLNPPDHAIVLCADEKSQIQALDRTQPKLPLNLGYVEGFTHDYLRHGTTTLFAALDVATGRVIAKCRKRHRHQDWIAFLNLIDKETPADLDIHLILDNYATHKHPKVKAWIAKRPRYHLHFTPTYASWLNQVERWFGLNQPASHQAGVVPQRQGTGDADHGVHRPVQYHLEAFRLGRDCPVHSSIRWNDCLRVLTGHYTSCAACVPASPRRSPLRGRTTERVVRSLNASLSTFEGVADELGLAGLRHLK